MHKSIKTLDVGIFAYFPLTLLFADIITYIYRASGNALGGINGDKAANVKGINLNNFQ